MAEYIDREAAYDYATLDSWYIASVTNGTPVWTEEHLEELLNDFFVIPKDTPAADVVEVKHGYWKMLVFKGGRRRGQAEAKCSICGRDAVYQITEEKWEFENYCPHCGAKMDGIK